MRAPRPTLIQIGLLLTIVKAAPVELTKFGLDGNWQRNDVNKAFVACMDGSLPQYYFKRSSTNDEDEPRKWLIFFEGGPICYDEASCDALVAAQTEPATSKSSSEGWPDTKTVGGIFDDDPTNAMADYNKVYMPYCTGDAWLSAFFEYGQQGPFFDEYYMKGYGSIYSLFNTLAEREELGGWLAGEDFVLAGAGEGAIGMLHSIELEALPFQEMLQAAVGATGLGLAREYLLLTIVDSAAEQDYPAYSDGLNLANRVKLLTQHLGMDEEIDLEIDGWNDAVNMGCYEAQGEDYDAVWKCVFGDYFLQYQTYPQVIFQNHYDMRHLSVQLGQEYGESFEWDQLDPEQQAYAAQYGQRLETFLNNFEFDSVRPINGYRGSIVQTSCGGEGDLLLSDRYYFKGAEADIRVAANMVVNDAIEFVFNEVSLGSFDCEAAGVQCTQIAGNMEMDGYISVADTCRDYDCNPTCAPYMIGKEPLPPQPEYPASRGVVFADESALDDYIVNNFEYAGAPLSTTIDLTSFTAQSAITVAQGQPIKIIVESFSHANNELQAFATTVDPAGALQNDGSIEVFAILGAAGTGDLLGYVDMFSQTQQDSELALTLSDLSSNQDYMWLIHENQITGADCNSGGGIYSVDGGSFTADALGSVKNLVTEGPDAIATVLGRSFVVYEGTDAAVAVACGTIYARPVGVEQAGFYNADDEENGIGKAIVLFGLSQVIAQETPFQINLKPIARSIGRNLAVQETDYFYINSEDTTIVHYETECLNCFVPEPSDSDTTEEPVVVVESESETEEVVRSTREMPWPVIIVAIIAGLFIIVVVAFCVHQQCCIEQKTVHVRVDDDFDDLDKNPSPKRPMPPQAPIQQPISPVNLGKPKKTRLANVKSINQHRESSLVPTLQAHDKIHSDTVTPYQQTKQVRYEDMEQEATKVEMMASKHDSPSRGLPQRRDRFREEEALAAPEVDGFDTRISPKKRSQTVKEGLKAELDKNPFVGQAEPIIKQQSFDQRPKELENVTQTPATEQKRRQTTFGQVTSPDLQDTTKKRSQTLQQNDARTYMKQASRMKAGAESSPQRRRSMVREPQSPSSPLPGTTVKIGMSPAKP